MQNQGPREGQRVSLSTQKHQDMPEILRLLDGIKTVEHFMAAWCALQLAEDKAVAAEEGSDHFLRAQITNAVIPAPFCQTLERPVEGLIFPDITRDGLVWFYTHPARRRWAGIQFPAFCIPLDKRGIWFDDVGPAEERDMWHAVNEADVTYSRHEFYRVHANHLDHIGVQAYALHEQDALDYAADYWEEMGWEGFFMDEESVEEMIADGYDDEILRLGNNCRPVLGHEVVVRKIE